VGAIIKEIVNDKDPIPHEYLRFFGRYIQVRQKDPPGILMSVEADLVDQAKGSKDAAFVRIVQRTMLMNFVIAKNVIVRLLP